jgi:hypothetical protein
LAARLFQMLHFALVEIVPQLTDGLIECGQAEKGAITQPRQDPPLHYLYSYLPFSFISLIPNSE